MLEPSDPPLRRGLQLAGLVLAIASVAEVLSLINGGFEHRHWRLVALETAMLLALALVVVGLWKLRSREWDPLEPG